MNPLQDFSNHPSYLYLEKEFRNRRLRVGIVLGSGFGDWVHSVEIIKDISYVDIPGFPVTTVEGHSGRLLLVKTSSCLVLVMQGRFHYYEGYSMDMLALPIRILNTMGIDKMVFTNASGGINSSYRPGDIMVLEDHINLTGNNPLIGPNDDRIGPRFPDASQIYFPPYREMAVRLAPSFGLGVHQGVYVYTNGPSFETPAEIRMMRIIGADAVGMSTVPEVLVANHAGMKILGLSLIANPAAGMTDHPLTHTVVMDTMKNVSEKINGFLNAVILEICHSQ